MAPLLRSDRAAMLEMSTPAWPGMRLAPIRRRDVIIVDETERRVELES